MTREYISKFEVLGLPWVRRPASEPPTDTYPVIVDNGEGGGWTDRQAAIFRDGEWRPFKSKALRFVPMFWSTLDLKR